MPVDKFGLTPENGSIIKTSVKYIYNLDDLENVKDFREEGKEDQIYGLKYKDGIYIRSELVFPEATSFVLLDPKMKNGETRFYYEDGKMIALPIRKWELDFRLSMDKIIVENGTIKRWINSGSLFVELSQTNEPKISFTFDPTCDYLYSTGTISFKLNTSYSNKGAFFNVLDKPPANSIIVIDLIPFEIPLTVLKAPDYVKIFKGFGIRWKDEHLNKKIRIVIIMGPDGPALLTKGIDYKIYSPLLLTEFDIHSFYLVRFRYSVTPLYDDEINFLD